jgi:GntR family transcriptional regulator/MocR family aminotransferase
MKEPFIVKLMEPFNSKTLSLVFQGYIINGNQLYEVAMSKRASQIDLPIPELERSSSKPLHQQVYVHLLSAIMAGNLKPRQRLPATRALATDWGVSRNIILLAFEQLTLEGYLSARTGSGTFVADEPLQLPDLPQPPATVIQRAAPAANSSLRQIAETQIQHRHTSFRKEIRPFQTSLPSLRDFPFQIWNRLAMQVYRGLHIQHLGYGDAAGHWPLREAIAGYVSVNRAVRCSPEQVVLVQGTQQALFLTGSLLLQPGDGFWMEDPGYTSACATLRAVGGIACPIPISPQGLDINYALTHYPHAHVAYVTPSHQYPLGCTMPYPTRKCLLDWAAQNEGWIIEDDYDSELRFCGRSLPSLQGLDQAGRVIYIGTYSKTLFPALRIGYVILPNPELAQLFIRAKALLDRQGPLVEQLILTKFIQEGHFGRHLRRMQQLYEQKQTWLLDALKGLVTPQGPLISDMGMHLLVWLPEGMDDKAVSDELAKHGVIAPSLSDYTLMHRKPPALLLGYAAFSKDQIYTAVHLLGQVLEKVTQQRN